MIKPGWAMSGLVSVVLLLAPASFGEVDPNPKEPKEPATKQHVTGKLPSIWVLEGNDQAEYEGGTDQSVTFGGKPSGYLKSTGLNMSGYGVLATAQDATPLRGRTARLSAQVKTDGVQRWCGLWIGVETPSHPFTPTRTKTPWFNIMVNDQSLLGTLDWKPASLDVTVPNDATRIVFGVAISGRGTAFINEVRVDAITPVTAPSAPSFDFPATN